jgi:hypothetical protein
VTAYHLSSRKTIGTARGCSAAGADKDANISAADARDSGTIPSMMVASASVISRALKVAKYPLRVERRVVMNLRA